MKFSILTNKRYCNSIIKQYADKEFENSFSSLKNQYKNSNQVFFHNDFGTGETKQKKVSAVAKKSSRDFYTAKLIYAYAKKYKPSKIIETGTNLGLSSFCFAKADKSTQIISIDACENISSIAENTFKKYDLNNILLINGDSIEQLNNLVVNNTKADMFLIDANHTYEATVNSFLLMLKMVDDKAIIFVDDIHWSKGMKKAWKEIIRHTSVTKFISLYNFGLVFIKK